MRKNNVMNLLDRIYNTTLILNFGALFSDGTPEYCNPPEPDFGDDVTIRFRTAKNNVDSVVLVVNHKRIKMEVAESNELFDFFEAKITNIQERTRYHFEVHSGRLVVYYNRLTKQKEINTDYDFELAPGFKTPDWARGAVFYQIYVDRFCNGDKSNDVLEHEYYYIDRPAHKVEDWDHVPEQMDVMNFYGGDLQGVMDKLDYLKDLGVDVIYLNPIFVSPSNHKYDCQDYDHIDPHFGRIVKDEGEILPEGATDNTQNTRYMNRVTAFENLEASDELFRQLVEEIHKRGMKIILDGVFNHCGSFNKWMDRELIYDKNPDYPKGAYVSKDSPYHEFFRFKDASAWPKNGTYDGWWGHDTLPKLNYEDSKELYDYIMRIGRKWVSEPYNIDGWRLDVAADLGYSEEFNHRFWRDFRKNVKEANPNAVILAEHYGDPKPWLAGDQWDTIMNYDAFMEPITWFLTGVEKHSDEFRGEALGNADMFVGAMRHYMASFLTGSLYIAMNELSNHDHSRFLTRTNRTVGRTHTLGAAAADQNLDYGIFREAVVFQMTWPGAPTIYYGDEAGVTGWTDPDNRRTYPWGHENKELIAFHKDIIRIHKSSEALMKGSLCFLHGEHKCIAYGRFTRNEAVAVVLNNDYSDKTVKLHVRHLGVLNNRMMKRILITSKDGYDLTETPYIVQDNMLSVVIPGGSAAIFQCKL